MADQRNTKELADEFLFQFGARVGVEDFKTDSSGLAKLSISGVGMVDFEIFDHQRIISLFVDVGRVPEDFSVLLRAPLEHVEMAGFSFCIDGFKSQALLTTSLPVDSLDIDRFMDLYSRLLACARYWRQTLSDPSADFNKQHSQFIPQESFIAA